MLRKRVQEVDGIVVATVLLVGAAAVALVMTLVLAGPAGAASGGVGMKSSSGKGGKARLLRSGRAIPPPDAPRRVVRAIEAGNKIRRKPYRYGGGHRRFRDRGYDCSGAVSFVLRGARMVRSPLDSSGLMRWGRRGKGHWITVYAHGGHAYMVVAGLRFDTSDTGGKGPRWHKDKRSKRGFKVRHFRNY
jgi:hypothetical protein